MINVGHPVGLVLAFYVSVADRIPGRFPAFTSGPCSCSTRNEKYSLGPTWTDVLDHESCFRSSFTMYFFFFFLSHHSAHTLAEHVHCSKYVTVHYARWVQWFPFIRSKLFRVQEFCLWPNAFRLRGISISPSCTLCLCCIHVLKVLTSLIQPPVQICKLWNLHVRKQVSKSHILIQHAEILMWKTKNCSMVTLLKRQTCVSW